MAEFWGPFPQESPLWQLMILNEELQRGGGGVDVYPFLFLLFFWPNLPSSCFDLMRFQNSFDPFRLFLRSKLYLPKWLFSPLPLETGLLGFSYKPLHGMGCFSLSYTKWEGKIGDIIWHWKRTQLPETDLLSKYPRSSWVCNICMTKRKYEITARMIYGKCFIWKWEAALK